MGPHSLIYIGLRPVAAARSEEDLGEPFVRLVRARLGMDALARGDGYEAVQGDGRISAAFGSWEDQQLFAVSFEVRFFEAIGDRVMMDLLMDMSTDWRLTMGRTSTEEGDLALQPAECSGPLTGLGWFQYLGPERARAWPADTWKNGPFYRVVIQADGSVGFCLGPHPFRDMRRRPAADYLGIVLPPLKARNPATGEPMFIPWR